jgi:hypothetical protein
MDASRFSKSEFRFSESEWDAISAQLAQIGRLKNDTDRQIFEMICGHFAQLRPRLGRNTPTPSKARDAWRKVAAEARKLETTIRGLRAAGAADFSVLDWFDDGHQAGWKSWSVQLSKLKEAADRAAVLEMAMARPVSNKADPMRDGLVRQVAIIWESYGGRISHTEDGPLLRFLSAVTAPTLIWAGEKPMSVEALRWSVRRIPRMAS